MKNTEYKKYTATAKIGIKGEAFFESLIADYAIPHQIVGPKDLGVDYICEWAYGDRPTGVLFCVQVKTFSGRRKAPKLNEKKALYSRLDKYEIKNSNLKISTNTLNYWRGLGLPAYVMAIYVNENGELSCYYKRYTGILTKKNVPTEINYFTDFYKVNDNNMFIAYQTQQPNQLGFARDLFIDHMRWNYFKGTISYMNPRTIGLDQFPEEGIFTDLFKEYKNNICRTFNKTKPFLEKVCK